MIRLMIALALAAPAAAATLPASPATFAAVLAKARGGDTILLDSAAFGTLVVRNRTFAPALTITGPDATVASVYVSMVNGLTFTNMNVVSPPLPSSNSQAIRIDGGSRVVFEKSAITGALAINGLPQTSAPGTPNPSGNIIGLPSGKAINLYKCNSCTVSGNFIAGFHKGVTFAWGTGLTIADNEIRNLRTTPISGAPGDDLTVSGNITSDSQPFKFGLVDHGDYLHLWTDDKTSPKRLRVTGNRFIQGGGQPMLGVNLQGKYGKQFIDALVSGNTVSGDLGQGFVLAGLNGARVENNVLIWTTGPSPVLGRDGKPVNWRTQPRLDIFQTSMKTVVCGTTGGPVALRKGTPASVVVLATCSPPPPPVVPPPPPAGDGSTR